MAERSGTAAARGRRARIGRAGPLLLALVALAGCAHTEHAARTYDAIVLELGPPDRAHALEDGGLRAVWFYRRPHVTPGLLGRRGSRTRTMWFDADGRLLRARTTRKPC